MNKHFQNFFALINNFIILIIYKNQTAHFITALNLRKAKYPSNADMAVYVKKQIEEMR